MCKCGSPTIHKGQKGVSEIAAWFVRNHIKTVCTTYKLLFKRVNERTEKH